MNVLIADDSTEFLSVAAHFVGKLPGVRRVATVTSGAAALEAVSRAAPDVLLLDFSMPDMSGLAVARAIVGRPGAPRVVLVTLFASDEMEAAARGAGIEHVVAKEAFAAEIPRLLGRLKPA